MAPKINDCVRWLDAPPAIAIFATGRVTAVSADGKSIRFGFVDGWLDADRFEPCHEPAAIKFCQLYRPLPTGTALQSIPETSTAIA